MAKSWDVKRQLVWKRDGGICQLCKRTLKLSEYECGHIVDKMCGGSDELDNLVVMCWACNHLKGQHETREEYEKWVESGFWASKANEALIKAGFEKDKVEYVIECLVRYGVPT